MFSMMLTLSTGYHPVPISRPPIGFSRYRARNTWPAMMVWAQRLQYLWLSREARIVGVWHQSSITKPRYILYDVTSGFTSAILQTPMWSSKSSYWVYGWQETWATKTWTTVYERRHSIRIFSSTTITNVVFLSNCNGTRWLSQWRLLRYKRGQLQFGVCRITLSTGYGVTLWDLPGRITTGDTDGVTFDLFRSIWSETFNCWDILIVENTHNLLPTTFQKRQTFRLSSTSLPFLMSLPLHFVLSGLMISWDLCKSRCETGSFPYAKQNKSPPLHLSPQHTTIWHFPLPLRRPPPRSLRTRSPGVEVRRFPYSVPASLLL